MSQHLRVAVASLVWLWAGSALAAADPMTVIPDDALGVAVVSNLSDTSTRIQKLTDKMQLPVPELLPMIQLYTGAQEGVDVDGSLAIAVLPDEREDITWLEMFVAFVPVTDYKAFIGQLQPEDAEAKITEVTIFGSQFLATNKGAFAVLAATSQQQLLEKIHASSKNVAGVVEPLRPWLDQQQIAVVLTPSGRKLVFDAIGGFLETGLEATAEADDDDEKKAEADPQAQAAGDPLEQFRELMGAFKDLLAASDGQLTQLGVGLRIDDTTALHLSTRVLFVPDGELSAWADEVKPPEKGLLSGMPDDKFMLVYGGVSPQFHPSVVRIIDRITQSGLSQLGLSEESRQKFAEALARHRENVQGTGTLMGQLRPGDTLLATSMSIEHVKDAKKHLTLTRDMFQTVADARMKGGGDEKPLYSVSDVKVGDLEALEVVTNMNAALDAAGQAQGAQGPAPEQLQGIFSRLFGNEGQMRAYVTVADEHTVVMAYSKEVLEHGVAHVRSGKPGMETDAAIAKTAALLPQGPQWAAYASPQGIVQWVDAVMKNMPAEMKVDIPPFPPSDPIGLAARVSKSGLDAEIVLPESVVAGIGQYVGTIQQMMQGGAPLP